MTTNVTAFSERFITAINTPQCDVLTGTIMGTYFFFKVLLVLLGAYVIIRTLEKLAFEPLLDWIKKKIYERRRKE